MKIADPAPIGTDGFTWQQSDGMVVEVLVMTATPYQDGGDRACPAAPGGERLDALGPGALSGRRTLHHCVT